MARHPSFFVLQAPKLRGAVAALLILACCCATFVAPAEAVSGRDNDIDLQPIVDALTASATREVKRQTASYPLDPVTYSEYNTVQETLLFRVPPKVDCSGAPIAFVAPPKSFVKAWKFGQPLNRSVLATCSSSRPNNRNTYEIGVAIPSGTIIRIREVIPTILQNPSRAARASAPQLTDRPRWNINTNISQELLKPASTFRKYGTGFAVYGNRVRWGNWAFHVRWDARVGMILSMLQYNNAGAADGKGWFRDVAYEMHISELFVPYLSPLQNNAFFDAGTFGLGEQGSFPLIPNNDCPHDAKYIHGVFWNSATPVVYPNAICVFERYSGDVSWRHASEYAKADVTLVVRSLSVLGNYDYLFDYEFVMDGTIKPKVQATGYPASASLPLEPENPLSSRLKKTLTASGIDPLKDGDDGISGTYVADNTIAPIHDHFFNYRMDLDIDGTGNTFVEGKMVGASWPSQFGGPPADIVKVVKTAAVSEASAVYTSSLTNPSQYLIVNPSKRTALGNVKGYHIHSSSVGRTFKTDADEDGACVPWARTQLTVTAYDPTQIYASGVTPTCFGKPVDGLAVWSKLNRPLKNRDLVVWHTVGFHHIPSQENWPYMSRASAGFTLEPFNFFEKNPLLYLPTWQDQDVV